MIDSPNDIEMTNMFLSMLDSDIVKTKYIYFDIGKVLYNIYKGNDEGLKIWYKLYPDLYDNLSLYKERYQTFSSNNYLTWKTLAWYARQYSLDKFNDWHTKWINEALEDCIELKTNAQTAEAIYRCYFLDFISASLNIKHLFYYKDNKWSDESSEKRLRYIIKKEFSNILIKLIPILCEQIQSSNDNRILEKCKLSIENICKIICHLKKKIVQRLILNELLELFYVENVRSILNSNTNLMAVSNGVLELMDDEIVFRPYKPEDYISVLLDIKYDTDFNLQHPLVMQLIQYIEKVFPDKELLQYFGKVAASCLFNTSQDFKLYVFLGSGNNSKTTLKNLFKETFGYYLLNFKNCCQTNTLTYSKIGWTDNFNKEQFNVCNWSNLFLDENKISMHNIDYGTKRRLRVIPFLSTWTHEAPTSIEQEYQKRMFKLDPNFNTFVTQLAPAFLWYMVEMFKLYKCEGLDEPELVKQYTEEYLQQSNTYLKFVKDCVKQNLSDKSVSVNNMYDAYRCWFKDNYFSNKIPDRSIFKSEISNILGKSIGDHWNNVDLITL